MVMFLSKHLGASLLFASTFAGSEAGCIERKLTYPEIVDLDKLSASGEALTLEIEWMEIDPGFGDSDGENADIDEERCGSTPFMTRALGGSVPGPTLTVSPGTTIRVKFNNKLTYQPESKSSRFVAEETGVDGTILYKTTTELNKSRLNKFNDPDIANLHFHGLHVSGILPSDDTTLEVLPQESFEYVVNIPEDHEPGIHWVHPHHHGSSTLHLVGGAALAMIVKDTKYADVMPLDIATAPEHVMVFQDWDITEALQTARHTNDVLFTESFSQIKGGESIGKRFVTVNGKYQPIREILAGRWERWRILYAGWQDLPLELAIAEESEGECEFHLLAKDGIYLSDYPRGPMMESQRYPLPIPPGGRADLVVRCHNPGATIRFEALGRLNTLVMNVVEGDESPTDAVTAGEEEAEATGSALERSVDTEPLVPWTIGPGTLPDYLQPVIDQNASDGCTCATKFEGYDDASRVNGQIYRGGNNFMHTSYLGAVVQRELRGMDEHSYHQHVYPYQIINVPNDYSNEGNEYFKIGDWHDTYLDQDQKGGGVTIRYKTTDIPGKIMVHCHNTLHADSGMIQKEYVLDDANGQCACDIFGPIDGSGIVDDVDSPKVIGGIPPVARSSAASLRVTHILSVMAAVVTAALV